MTAYRVIRAREARVEFDVENEAGESLVFSLPKMQYMSEDQARLMKIAVREVDAPVQQVDPDTDEPLWEKNPDGTDKLNDDGEKMPVMGTPQRTTLERTRVTALTMLQSVTEPTVFEELNKKTTGELDDILEHWTLESMKKKSDAVDLGESSASSNS